MSVANGLLAIKIDFICITVSQAKGLVGISRVHIHIAGKVNHICLAQWQYLIGNTSNGKNTLTGVMLESNLKQDQDEHCI